MRTFFKINALVFTAVLTIAFLSGLAHAYGDTIPPSIPTSVGVSVSGSGQLAVSWGASTDNVGVAGYYVYRNGAQIANTNSTSYTDSGLTPAVYAYTVAAYDAARNVSGQSVSASATAVVDTTPPSVPTDLTVTTIGYHPPQMTISWSGSTDDFGVGGYYVIRNRIKIITGTAITATTYTDTDVAVGNTYTYQIQAYDVSGNISGQSAAINAMIPFDTVAPSIPAGVSAVATSATAIAVSWAPSTGVEVAGYYVYQNGSQVGDTGSASTTVYVDSGLSPGTYGYAVAAYDLAGNVSSRSSPVNVMLVLDTIPPSTPTGLIARAVSSTQVDLSWHAAADNVGVVGYDVYRDGSQIGSTSMTSYSDTGVVASTTYVYTVAAYDISANISTSSASLIITTPNGVMAPTPASISNGSITVSPGSQTVGSFVFTLYLYQGARNSEVANLQTVLIQDGYLGANFGTGYFGARTAQAVRRFQCDHGIVCTGGPFTTGWGAVGGRTRAALNNLPDSSTKGGGTSSTAQLNAQLQALQALLASLQLQAQALQK